MDSHRISECRADLQRARREIAHRLESVPDYNRARSPGCPRFTEGLGLRAEVAPLTPGDTDPPPIPYEYRPRVETLERHQRAVRRALKRVQPNTLPAGPRRERVVEAAEKVAQAAHDYIQQIDHADRPQRPTRQPRRTRAPA